MSLWRAEAEGAGTLAPRSFPGAGVRTYLYPVTSFRISRRPALLLVAVLLVLGILGVGAGAGSATGGSPATVAHFSFGSDWPQYHHDGLGSGVDPSGTNLSPARAAWNTGLDGPVFGEPLVEAGRVIVATENDTVYELAASGGQVMWASHVGNPVPSSALPCGDISPTVGITGTPVIDPSSSEIFVVADEDNGGAIGHFLIGLDLYTGVVLLRQQVDPGGTDPATELQRTGLALDDGRVDSGAGNHAGAIWMGGAAPVVDNQGNVWVASGNGFGSNPAPGNPSDSSDAVLKLTPGLQLADYFVPSSWQNDNNNDLDLGSSSPALINGVVFQAGKSQTGYLMNGSHLGGVGGQSAILQPGSFCGNDVDGGNAVDGTVVYVPCMDGVEAVQVSSTTSANVLWKTPTGSAGPAIVAGGEVWTIGGATLRGLNPANGTTVQSFALNGEDNHFPTPSVADGLLLAPEAHGVAAFVGPAGLPPPPPAAPPRPGYWLAARDGGVFSFSTPYQGSVPGLHAHVTNIVGMAYDAATGG
jgi:hypothetical protein